MGIDASTVRDATLARLKPGDKFIFVEPDPSIDELRNRILVKLEPLESDTSMKAVRLYDGKLIWIAETTPVIRLF